MLRDFVNREIKLNDTVIYPVRRGSSLKLKRIRITQIVDGNLVGYNPDATNMRRVVVSNIHNCIVQV